MGVPPVIIHLNVMFHGNKASFFCVPPFMETPMYYHVVFRNSIPSSNWALHLFLEIWMDDQVAQNRSEKSPLESWFMSISWDFPMKIAGFLHLKSIVLRWIAKQYGQRSSSPALSGLSAAHWGKMGKVPHILSQEEWDIDASFPWSNGLAGPPSPQKKWEIRGTYGQLHLTWRFWSEKHRTKWVISNKPCWITGA